MKPRFAARRNQNFQRLDLQTPLFFGKQMPPMNRFFTLFLLSATLTARAALPQPDLIARIHFAGGDAVAADRNYSAFTNEFSSAEALALRRQVADRLAPWLAGWLQANAGAGAGAENLRPLFDDLQSAEWFFEARTSAGKPSGYLAIKLSPARLQLWKTNLKSLPFGIADSRGWLFFSFGDTVAKLNDLRPPVPIKAWLECDVNWTELAHWYPRVRTFDLPETLFDVTAGDGQIRIFGKFYFPQNITARLDPWKLPVSDMHEPLTSFTAVRGFAPWLAGQAWARPWQLSPPVNQLFVWSLNGTPFQTFAAAPVNDPVSALHQLYQNLQPVLSSENSRGRFTSQLNLKQANDRVTVSGTPIIKPEIKAETTRDGNFLIAGAFPNPPGGKPLPAALLQALALPNLVYYHWELVAPRLPALQEYSALAQLITKQRQLNGNSVAAKWMKKSGSLPGYTATEIIQSAPDQMTFVRSAPAGLTAFEFFALAIWLEAPDFPHCNLERSPAAGSQNSR